jgi:hypothetical protein
MKTRRLTVIALALIGLTTHLLTLLVDAENIASTKMSTRRALNEFSSEAGKGSSITSKSKGSKGKGSKGKGSKGKGPKGKGPKGKGSNLLSKQKSGVSKNSKGSVYNDGRSSKDQGSMPSTASNIFAPLPTIGTPTMPSLSSNTIAPVPVAPSVPTLGIPAPSLTTTESPVLNIIDAPATADFALADPPIGANVDPTFTIDRSESTKLPVARTTTVLLLLLCFYLLRY